jgi:hypothetical protein
VFVFANFDILNQQENVHLLLSVGEPDKVFVKKVVAIS